MSIAAGPNMITSGLVLYLDAANTKSYPGIGPAWTDLSDNGDNGTLVNGVGYNSVNGGYLTFDGIDDHVNGNIPIFAVGSGATIDAMVRLNNVTNLSAIFSHGRSGSSFDLGMVVISSNLRFRNTNNDYALSSPTTLSTGVWYHLALSITSTSTTGYCNGLSQGTTAQVITSNAITDYYISRRSSNSATEHVDGNIAVLRVYNRALTASEIQQNFNATRSRFGI